MTLPAVCPQCDALFGFETELVFPPGKPPHGLEIRCGSCNYFFGYQPKPENEGKRRDHNTEHRKEWLTRHFGDLLCSVCRRRQSQLPGVDFHIDHLWPLDAGGPDETWNTAPLCRTCHTIAHGIERIGHRPAA